MGASINKKNINRTTALEWTSAKDAGEGYKVA